jgi:hypothetical protein
MNVPEQKLPVAMQERPFVIWGFRDMSHTHGYIHANFYRVLKRNHATVHWLDDTPQNLSKIPNGSIVLTVNIACNYLIPTPKNMYIAHNCHDSETFKEFIFFRGSSADKIHSFLKSKLSISIIVEILASFKFSYIFSYIFHRFFIDIS